MLQNNTRRQFQFYGFQSYTEKCGNTHIAHRSFPQILEATRNLVIATKDPIFPSE